MFSPPSLEVNIPESYFTNVAVECDYFSAHVCCVITVVLRCECSRVFDLSLLQKQANVTVSQVITVYVSYFTLPQTYVHVNMAYFSTAADECE